MINIPNSDEQIEEQYRRNPKIRRELKDRKNKDKKLLDDDDEG